MSKDNSVQSLFKEFNKKYGAELFSIGTIVHKCERIPFTSKRANYMLYGGLPRGRVVEFSGPEGSGKTTTAHDVVANAQKLFHQEWIEKIEKLESLDKLTKEQSSKLLQLREDGPLKCLWIDCENTFDSEWAETLGVNVEELCYMSPESQSAEEIFEMIIKLIETGEIGLCVIDSLGMMVSQQEMEKTVEDKTYGGIAMALTKFSKKVELICAKMNCMLIGINQERENIAAAGYGGPTTTTPGGKCWRHTCSVRLSFRAGIPFDEKYNDVKKSCENPFGHKVMISVVKTKICKPDRKLGKYTLVYSDGIMPLYDLIDIAILRDIIHKSGAWFTFINPYTGEVISRTDEDGNEVDIKVQGMTNIIPFLQLPENENILNMISEYVDKIILGCV